MTTILATGDNHFVQGPRWGECLRIHRWIAELVHERRPDLFLLTGDSFERRPNAEERAAFADFLTAVAEVCPIIGVRGNHDFPLEVEFYSRLRTKHRVVMEEGAAVHLGGPAVLNGRFDRRATIAVAAFAWPSRAMLAATLGEQATPEMIAQSGRDAMRNVLMGLGLELSRYAGPRILLGHAHVVGARVGERGQPLEVGSTIALGTEDLALAGADVNVLGHIHLPQMMHDADAPSVYCGSPFRHTFGESEEKSIVELRFERSKRDPEGRPKLFAVDRIPTPCTEMALLEFAYADGGLSPEPGTVDALARARRSAGAEVRIRYEVRAAEREAARRKVAALRDSLLGSGASLVKTDERVIADVRARVPEVSTARTLQEQLATYKPETYASEKAVTLLAKLGELEGEAT